MKNMQFNVKQVKDFLNDNGLVVTVRGYDMQNALVNVEGIGTCRRRKIGRIYKKEELEKVLEYSGFKDIDEWWLWIERFKCVKKFVYLVKKKPKVKDSVDGNDIK